MIVCCAFGQMAFAEKQDPGIPADTAFSVPGGFTASVNGTGFELRDPIGRAIAFRVGGLARADRRSAWQAGTPIRNGNELYYPGPDMGVHYVHTPQGLRQNFMVYGRMSGDGPLRVLLGSNGSLRATATADGITIVSREGEHVLDYRDLHCWDSEHRTLPAHFAADIGSAPGGIAIVVDDRDAVYPITVDPVATTPSTLLIGAAASAEFGIAVSTAGDLNGDGRSDVVVGAWLATMNGFNASGAAYVYYGTNNGISTVPSVTLTVAQNGAQFGCAVSTAGDVNGDGFSDLLIGSRTWESNTVTELSEGAVFVYYGSSTGISTSPNLTLQPDHADDNFGSNVACAGDINNDGYSDVLVGAYLSSYPTLNEGAVFVYMGSATGLNPVAQHRLERNQGGAFFGRSVAGAGDVNGDGFSDVIIGSSKYIYTVGLNDQGSAFVYYGSALGLGVGLNPAPGLQLYGTGNSTAYFGWWVSSAGDLNGDGYSDVAVTAYNDNIGGQTQEGLVFVYHGSAAGLNATAAIVLQSNQVNAWMGRCVSTAGDVNGDGYADLFVGSPRYTNGESLEGVGQIFLGSASGVSATASFLFELNNAGSNLGESVGPAGDVNGDGYSDMIIGARIYGSGGATAVYLGGPYSVNATPSLTRAGGAAGNLLGSAVANAGDINGDGYADAVVGAPGASNGQAGEGLVYVHYGSASGLNSVPSLTLEANVAGAQFGASVASAGDVNGDGYADVVVGAPLNGSGKAYIYLGSPAGLVTVPTTTLSGGLLFGSSVAGAGDVDADGYGDVAVGAPGSGLAYVYNGSIAGITTTPVITLSEPPASGQFGCAVSTAGDVNGDGFSDLIVGARSASNGQSNEGLAYVFKGGWLGITMPHIAQLEINQANADLGVSVSSAGDVNGDGFGDVIVGADLYDNGQTDEGAAWVFYGMLGGVNTATPTKLERNIADGRMGRIVAEGGDVNGDGYADVIVAAPLSENPAATANEGIVYVYRGASPTIVTTGYDQLEMNVAGYEFGTAVSGGGDVDGDGYSDVLIGAPKANPAFANEGSFYWFRGDVARALERCSRQYDADLITPLSTNSIDFANLNFFGIGHRARSPIQRCKVRLRWEMSFEGIPFTGVPITNSVSQTGMSAAWTMLPPAGVEIKQLLPKNLAHMRYRWRVRVEYAMAKLIDGQRFSRWFYGYANGVGDIGVLPVELLSFTGRANDRVNDLFWTTASEHNSDHFEVQRAHDGRTFEPIGAVAAAGESASALDYRFTDLSPHGGTEYYRIRTVDHDGRDELSEVVAITRATGIRAVYPNPVHDEAHVAVGAHSPESTLSIIDAKGRTLSTRTIMDDASTYTLNVRDLAAGAYTVLLRSADGQIIGAMPLIKD